MREFQTGRLSPEQLHEALKKGEAETIDELGRTLGAERARQFRQATRGQLPDGYQKHE